METLEGIMIATTNLTTNLDKAFERRFLYKIRFDKPTLESQAKIGKQCFQVSLNMMLRHSPRNLISQVVK